MHHKSDVLDLDLEPQDDEVVVSSKYDEAVFRLVKIMSDTSLRFFARNADSSTGQVGLLDLYCLRAIHSASALIAVRNTALTPLPMAYAQNL